jgi:hypothetical protein
LAQSSIAILISHGCSNSLRAAAHFTSGSGEDNIVISLQDHAMLPTG